MMMDFIGCPPKYNSKWGSFLLGAEGLSKTAKVKLLHSIHIHYKEVAGRRESRGYMGLSWWQLGMS